MKIRITKHKLRIMVKMMIFIALFMIHNSLFIIPAFADDCVTKEGVKIGSCFGFGGPTSLGGATSQLVMPVFSVAATIVIIFFIWGAFNFLKSGGNKEEVAGARNMITHAIVGFIILIFAFLILQFLLSSLFGITGFQLFQS